MNRLTAKICSCVLAVLFFFTIRLFFDHFDGINFELLLKFLYYFNQQVLELKRKRSLLVFQLRFAAKYKTNVQPPLRSNGTPLMIPIIGEAVCRV